MTDPLRVGVLGLADDHLWKNLDALDATGQAVIAAMADPRPELRERARRRGCDRLFEDPVELLDNVELDAVYVFSDNRTSGELAIAAAQRGLHVMVIKPMAADLAGAARMRGAAHAAGVVLMIDWPFIWWPSLQLALDLVARGRIGRVLQVDYRAAHAGPREVGVSAAFSEWLYDPSRGGGALMDYCCYGVALACLLLGLPSSVTAVTGRLDKADLYAEDTAVIVMRHAAAISTASGAWTQVGQLGSYEPTFHGSDGTLLVRRESLSMATRGQEQGVELDLPEPPPELRSSAAAFVHHVRTRTPVTGICSPEVSLAAQEVLEAALLSAREGRTVPLPLPAANLR